MSWTPLLGRHPYEIEWEGFPYAAKFQKVAALENEISLNLGCSRVTTDAWMWIEWEIYSVLGMEMSIFDTSKLWAVTFDWYINLFAGVTVTKTSYNIVSPFKCSTNIDILFDILNMPSCRTSMSVECVTLCNSDEQKGTKALIRKFKRRTFLI